ncbi:hypothetical protein PCNPT3_09535 [Psychromonas sp. CNPT3]|uniref:DUF3301 domain-containing protein n=1 Tax=Psychromonas sp. CNPT3 TaxID=314282 RepID=UPI00006E9144|nr:DUF3301 domain-containing protein [Psychromonas sp. CNPT3]AGH81845.1 hypothetical protein PCNPT3_09535 [Psychromonas sp. CNPT3]
MFDLLLILFFVCFALLIWKCRQQSEHANIIIENKCRVLDLQLLNVSRSHFNYKPGKHFLEARFIFEFSSDNENSYQGALYLAGLNHARFELPVYRTFESSDTLH